MSPHRESVTYNKSAHWRTNADGSRTFVRESGSITSSGHLVDDGTASVSQARVAAAKASRKREVLTDEEIVARASHAERGIEDARAAKRSRPIKKRSGWAKTGAFLSRHKKEAWAVGTVVAMATLTVALPGVGLGLAIIALDTSDRMQKGLANRQANRRRVLREADRRALERIRRAHLRGVSRVEHEDGSIAFFDKSGNRVLVSKTDLAALGSKRAVEEYVALKLEAARAQARIEHQAYVDEARRIREAEEAEIRARAEAEANHRAEERRQEQARADEQDRVAVQAERDRVIAEEIAAERARREKIEAAQARENIRRAQDAADQAEAERRVRRAEREQASAAAHRQHSADEKRREARRARFAAEAQADDAVAGPSIEELESVL